MIKTGYLPSVAGGTVTWVVMGKCPVAVIAQGLNTLRLVGFLVDETSSFSEFIEDKIHIQYRSQTSPESIFERLKRHVPQPTFSQTRKARITGTLIGTAVGDAIGLPFEGISRRRAKRLFP
ncbi:MAG: ADP-ribosylglycohydrolase family protein, partial [Planctomycetaceae bacterium]|nr:ADP-ribosylglycohydrolase family protein [Planctomycetaceae bacterium]